MALLAGLVIAALPDRAALTFAVVPSANISASFTTSTISPQNKSDQIYFRLFASDKTESCEFQDNWVKTPSQDSMGGRLLSLTNPWSVLSAIGKIGFAQFCTFSGSQLCTFTKQIVQFQLFTIVNFHLLTIVYFHRITIVYSDNCAHQLQLRLCAVWPVRKSSGVPECQHRIVRLPGSYLKPNKNIKGNV